MTTAVIVNTIVFFLLLIGCIYSGKQQYKSSYKLDQWLGTGFSIFGAVLCIIVLIYNVYIECIGGWKP